MATGPVTSGDVSAEVLRTLQIAAAREYDAQINLKSIACQPTWKDTIEVYQSGKTMKKAGSDTELATLETADKQSITIPEPTKYHTGYGITNDSLKRGVTQLQAMQEFATAVDSDRRLINQLIMKCCFTDGGWWDTTATPPRAGNNVMAATQDHYHAYAVDGVPALAHIARAKREIQEHDIECTIVGMLNGDEIEALEGQAEYVSAVANKTPLLNEWQIKGITPQFEIDGVQLMKNDYVPPGYGLFLGLNALYKPLVWRFAFQPNDTEDGLIRYAEEKNEAYYMKERVVRWGAVEVAMRSLGVVVDFNHATYVAPTVSEWSSI